MPQTSFPKTEEQILAFWKENKIFQKTLEKTSPKGDFVFYDGPPFATGLPHYGHIIAGTIKDVIPRYKTMQGFRVARRWGWDCHGLPIENLIEQEKGFKEKKEIEQDIAGFNKACRDSVLRYRDEWKKSVDRTGRWVDMENDYKTMDNRYIEAIWWIFKELYKAGLIYEGYKSMHLCPRCETTLSNFEVTLGYKEVKDLGVTVKFRITNAELRIKNLEKDASVYMLAWTTTPWTLPGNIALAVGEDIEYAVMQVEKSTARAVQEGDVYIIAVESEQGMKRWDAVKVYQQNIPNNVVKRGGEYWEIIEKGNKDDRDKPFKPDTLRHWTPDMSKADVQGAVSISDQEQIWWRKIGIVKGTELIGTSYISLFDFSEEQVKNDSNYQNAFKVYAGDFVNTEQGNGIVHIAPAFGEDDYKLSLKENLPFLQHVNYDGTFKEYVVFAPGKKVKTKEDPTGADVEVIKYLAAHDALFKKEKYSHSYPHCWRCDTPLINYAASSWFVKVTALKDRLLEANSKVKWVPEHIRDGRFGKWLEGARDWAISRSRYWGAPLPAWRCEQCKEIAVIGSVAELNNKQNKTPEKSEVLDHSAEDSNPVDARRDWHRDDSINQHYDIVKGRDFLGTETALAGGLEPPKNEVPTSSSHHATNAQVPYHHIKAGAIDLHRPYIDEIVFPCGKCGGAMRRIKEVFDCWFESGAMPYASEIMFSDYRLSEHTTRDELRKHIPFPPESTQRHGFFIAEGTDQTRGWFYTLMVLGVALYNESPFKNVIVNGIILAEDGQKMSKRLKNYPDPHAIMDKYGADAMRFYLMSSPAVRAEALNFSEKGVDEVYKKVILLTLNVVNFYTLFCQGKLPKEKGLLENIDPGHKLDKWIISKTHVLIGDITLYLDQYEIDKACRTILDFIDNLSTWYIRGSRDRFKAGDPNAVAVLSHTLLNLAKVVAPIVPFLGEYIYKEIQGPKESVHLETWPDAKEYLIFEDVIDDMEVFIRKRDEIILIMDDIRKISEVGHSLRSESGHKVRQPLKEIQVKKAGFEERRSLFYEEFVFILQEELNVSEVVFVDQLPEGEGWISKDGVALYTIMDESLKEQGIARELTRQINNLRKKQGLTIQDRVIVEYGTDSATLQSVIEKYQEELKEAVLALNVSKVESGEGEPLDIDGEKIYVTLLCRK